MSLVVNVVLTNVKTNRKVMVNFLLYHTSYELYDENLGQLVTKIFFSKDSHIIVKERLETIHGILVEMIEGFKQKNVNFDSSTLDEVIEKSFNDIQGNKHYQETEFNRESVPNY